jgi:hypothetical protein
MCFFSFESFTMATRSVLERYYHRLPAGDGSGSSTSAGIGSLIASSANDGDGQMHLLHSVCPPVKRRKLQPQGVTPCNNHAVKLLMPAPHVQDEGDTRTNVGGVAA